MHKRIQLISVQLCISVEAIIIKIYDIMISIVVYGKVHFGSILLKFK